VDLLKDEMKKIQEKLDTLLTADLKVAGTYFVEANTYLGLGDEAEAISRYREAKKSAIEAIHRVQKIDQLVQAYKIRLLSEYMKILITCKSICEEEEKAKKIRNFCITALASLNELHTHPKIVSAVEHQLDPPLLGKKSERELLLSELHKLDYWIISVSKLANLDLKAVKKQLITNTKAVQVDPLQLMELLNNLSETLEGHTNSVWSVCSSGDKIVSGSWDHSVRVWDMNTCECVHFLQGHTDGVRSVLILNDLLSVVLKTKRFEYGI
jgi:WD40 repeat protein